MLIYAKDNTINLFVILSKQHEKDKYIHGTILSKIQMQNKLGYGL